MRLDPGLRLGPYEILDPLGAGGMGEVYRARDTRLKRDVAIKVLPSFSTDDPQRMLRFEREAQLLAALNHPNVAHIYGVEESNGARALVMELVEGPTIAERLAKGPIPPEESLQLALQIAEGLEYAHDRNVVHRDLKPANIKVTPEGQVKILDFGLAKALDANTSDAEIANSPTISVAATNVGVLLGTAGYTSPEQAKGKPVDRRTDIWAFGCVLYEMLTGTPAFEGETITDKLAAVVRAEPELSKLPEQTPRPIRELLQRCFAKDPRQRLQAIGEARIAIDRWLANPTQEEYPLALASEPTAKVTPREFALGGVILLLAGLCAVLGYSHWTQQPADVRVVRSSIRAIGENTLNVSPSPGFALSPDGTRFAYVSATNDGRLLLWVRPLDSVEAEALPGTEGARYPFWSPDGKNLGYFAAGRLKRIAATGGPSTVLCDASDGRGGSWNDKDQILFTPTVMSGVYLVSAAGGEPREITKISLENHETSNRWPQFLPDGKHFLYTAGSVFSTRENPTNTIRVSSLDGGPGRPILHVYGQAAYVKGYLVYNKQNNLVAQPFDAERLEVSGEPIVIVKGVLEEGTVARSSFSVSNAGQLVYVEGELGAKRRLALFDRSGKIVKELPMEGAFVAPRMSPDGTKIVFYEDINGYNIWTYDLEKGAKTQLTFQSAAEGNFFPIWSPDGKKVAYAGLRGGRYGLMSRSADGAGSEETLLSDDRGIRFLSDWSSDGKTLVFGEGQLHGWKIGILPLGSDRKPIYPQPANYSEREAVFSPDGRWLAYCSNESGDYRIYVVAYPGPGGKWEASNQSGFSPRWRGDGKELFFMTPSAKVVAVELGTKGDSLEVGAEHVLFDSHAFGVGLFGAFDVRRDGQIVVLSEETGRSNGTFTLVTNWDAALKKP